MNYRKLRIAWSVGWGVVAVLLCVLWVRSYSRVDDVRHAGSTITQVASYRGWIHAIHFPAVTQTTNENWLVSTPINDIADLEGPLDFFFRNAGYFYAPMGFAQQDWFQSGDFAIVPQWIVTTFCGTIAIIPWLRFRFSLRTLLIATTLVALLLGLFVWLAR